MRTNSKTKTKTTTLEDFKNLTIHLASDGWIPDRHWLDLNSRRLICTLYDGCYGSSGWVVCLEGSPPRLTMLIQTDGMEQPQTIIAVAGGRSKQLGKLQRQTVCDFCKHWLTGQDESFTIAGKNGPSFTLTAIDHSGRHIPRSADNVRIRDARGLLDDAAVVEATVSHATVAQGTRHT